MTGALDDRRQDLGKFLRSRRERTRVSDFGFPEGRRRTPGLRREEVALLAGVSPTWYTYLEQGRDIRPSSDVLDRLADVLALTSDERTYLHVLAVGQRPQRQVKTPPPELLALLERLVNDQPHPCYASNSSTDILAWNTASTVLYTNFAALPPTRRNLLWWIFTSPEAHERFVVWAEEAHDILNRCRSALARRTDSGDEVTDGAIQDLLQVNTQALEWWQEHSVRDHAPRVRTLRAADGEVRRYMILPLFELFGYDCGVVFHFPHESTEHELTE
jgi:transcriptional regulator with XRE-family HTH domain